MPGTSYDVEIRYFTKGDLGLPTRNLSQSLKSLEKGFGELSGGTLSALGSAIDGIASGLMTAATAGAGALAAGLGVVSVVATRMNAELESTQIALGGLFMAANKASPWADAMSLAGGVMKEMRKDAQVLPGTFKDLEGMYQTMALSAFHAGASPEGFEKTAAKAMAVSKITNLPTQQFAREMSGLIEGHAGQHNILGMRMLNLSGDSAKAFNAKPITERYKIVTDALNRYDDALKAYGNTFDAHSTTFIDNLKYMAAEFGGPIFESMKKVFASFNEWYSNHSGQISQSLHKIGANFAKMFDVGIEKFKTFIPFLEKVEHRLENGKLFGDIGAVLGAVGGLKLGAAGVGIAGSMQKMFDKATRGMFGAPEAFGGAGAAAATAAGLSAESIVATGGAALLAFAALSAAALAGAGALESLTNPLSKFHDQSIRQLEEIMAEFGGVGAKFSQIWTDLKPLAELMGSNLLNTVVNLAGAINTATGWVTEFSYAVKKVAEFFGFSHEHSNLKVAEKAKDFREHADALSKRTQDLLTPPNTNVNIGQVVFNVAANNSDPSRIARTVESTLANMAKRNKSSRRVVAGSYYR